MGPRQLESSRADAEFGQATTPLQFALPARIESVAEARAKVVEFAAGQGADCDGIALAVSEAVANAVSHGCRGVPDSMVRVEARLNGDALVVSVSDEGPGFKPRLTGSESGLGLALMATIAASLTVDRQAGTGTRVSMRFR